MLRSLFLWFIVLYTIQRKTKEEKKNFVIQSTKKKKFST